MIARVRRRSTRFLGARCQCSSRLSFPPSCNEVFRAQFQLLDPGAPNCPVTSLEGLMKLNEEGGKVAKWELAVYPYDEKSPVGTVPAFDCATTSLASLAAVLTALAARAAYAAFSTPSYSYA